MPGFNPGGSPSPTLADVGDINRVHRWSIAKIAGIVPRGILYAVDMTMPSFGVEEETLAGASMDYKIPKKVKFNDVTVKFYDSTKLVKDLQTATRMMFTLEDGLRRADSYMGETTFELLDGEGKKVYGYTLINSYIKTLSHSDLSYSNNDMKQVIVEIGYTYPKFNT